jgi:hypothetical protein
VLGKVFSHLESQRAATGLVKNVALIMIACRFFGHCLFFTVDRLIETTYSKSGLLRVRQAPPLAGSSAAQTALE